jgi:hypothetical protein
LKAAFLSNNTSNSEKTHIEPPGVLSDSNLPKISFNKTISDKLWRKSLTLTGFFF